MVFDKNLVVLTVVSGTVLAYNLSVMETKLIGHLRMEYDKGPATHAETLQGWRTYCHDGIVEFKARNVRVIVPTLGKTFCVYYMKTSKHNRADIRYDVSFSILNPETQNLEQWHGTSYGYAQDICYLHKKKDFIHFPSIMQKLKEAFDSNQLNTQDLYNLKMFAKDELLDDYPEIKAAFTVDRDYRIYENGMAHDPSYTQAEAKATVRLWKRIWPERKFTIRKVS